MEGRSKRYQTGWKRTDSKYKLVILVPYQLLLHKDWWGCGAKQLIKSGCHLSVKDTHCTLSRAWDDHRGQSWINVPETVFPHESLACCQEMEAPQTMMMSSSGKKNMKLRPSCHLFYSVFLPNIMTFLVSHQAYRMTQRVVINLGTHSHTHTCTVLSALRVFSGELPDSRCSQKELKTWIWGWRYKIKVEVNRVVSSKISFHDWFSLSYTKWNEEVVCRQSQRVCLFRSCKRRSGQEILAS